MSLRTFISPVLDLDDLTVPHLSLGAAVPPRLMND